MHGVDLSKIHFHEVGAVDSIIDIVGSAVGLDLLGVDRFEASPVPPGKGWIKAAHGRMALPAPATAEILKGVPLAESMVEMELTTPTGAAILTTVVERFGPLPALTIETIGLGAGTRDLPEQANVLRLFVGHRRSAARQRPGLGARDQPRRPARRGRRLHDDQADGSRRARRLRHPDPDEEEPAGRDGQRPLRRGQDPAHGGDPLPRDGHAGHPPLSRQPAQAEAARRSRSRPRSGSIRGKLGWLENRPPTFSPEYDDCARIASTHGVALREVYDAAHAAYQARQTQPELLRRPAQPHSH